VRSALLLPARAAYHDSDFACRTGEEIRSESLKMYLLAFGAENRFAHFTSLLITTQQNMTRR